MYHALCFPPYIFTLYVPCFLFFLIDHNQKQVLLIKWVIFLFWSSKIFFCSIQLFENGHIHNFVSTLINVVKLDVENSSIVSTLSNVVNVNVEIDNVDLTLFNVINFNFDMHNVASTLMWHCLTSRRHITLTATLEQRWKVSWVLTNAPKRLHNFVKFINLKTYIFSRMPLNCCFSKLSKRCWKNNFGLKKKKNKTEKNIV